LHFYRLTHDAPPPVKSPFPDKKGNIKLHFPFDLPQSAKAGTPKRREVIMDGFVARQNIAHYRGVLKTTTDPAARRRIEELLLAEEAKLKKYEEDHNHERQQPPTRRQG
jgi:hypothetical protein